MSLPAYAMNQASFPEMYERLLVPPLFRPWVDDLLQRATLISGDRVLDIACGTGIVARVASERLGDRGRVVAVDVSAPMLAVARSRAPTIDWREGSAEALPVREGETFDAITCQQGLQFFRDKAAAVREMRRVAAPGARVVVAVWRSLEEMPRVQQLNRIAEGHFGPIADARYGFGDAEALKELLLAAGFREVTLDTLSKPIRFDDPADFVRLNAMALVGMSAASADMKPEERARHAETIAAESLSALESLPAAERSTFEFRTNVAVARAPDWA